MKVLCERERLREALAVANTVVPVKSTRPAIENVLLIATDDALELVGTDLEAAVRYRIDDVKVEEPGSALIPARVSADFVRDLSGETIRLATDGEHCTITSGSDHCELVTIDPDEFPDVARFADGGGLGLQGGTFAKLVNRTAFAAAKEQGRYAMHGILTLIEDDQLKMVATDGRRLAVAASPLDTEANGKELGSDLRAIVPTKGMQLLCRVITDPLEQVTLQFREYQVGLKAQLAEIFAQLIDGEFPRYSAVIPEAPKHAIEADAELLSKKLRLVSNVTSADTRAVRLSLSKGQMKIFAKSSGTGEASAQLEVTCTTEPEDIAFNPDYIVDGLKNCEADVVRIEYTDKASPGKFTLGENYLYVVMPITIDT